MAAGMRPASCVLALAIGAAAVLGGCGAGANGSPAPLPIQSVGPAATVTAAVSQTRATIAAALTTAGVAVQLGDATRPYRPAESARLRDAPRAVYQVLLPDQPDAGFVVVYEFPDAASAVNAGNEEAGYLGTGPAKVQFPPDAQHVLQVVGTTLVLYTWSPTASSDPTAGNVADALKRLGIGFSVPR
ncbi:MAG: hypothetical protein QOI09_763 [Chloroflexota bacterium]|nr:hypothetical protein [Chloroflexota bacterium]